MDQNNKKSFENSAFDIFVPAAGGSLLLHVRKNEVGEKLPVICIPGLTRNERDFDELAAKIAERGHPVFALSLRGRGHSSYDPDFANYHPLTYRDDVLAVMDELEISQAIFVGTSLGGIVTMLMAETFPERIAGAIINDVGPELAAEGIARISGYVGGDSGPASDIDQAAKRIRAINEVAFPGQTDKFWQAFAKRTHRLTSQGWVLDYDANIAEAFKVVGPAPDLWPGWNALAAIPTLLVHGALSDLLTDPIIAKMRSAHPKLKYVRVENTGHAPFMTEPDAWAAIMPFLERLDIPQ